MSANDELLAVLEAGEAAEQIAAARSLKQRAETGVAFDEQAARRIFELLASDNHWEATLNLLQTLPYLPIAEHEAEPLCDTLLALAENRNRFIRAWAYSGLHHLAQLHRRYRRPVRALLRKAAGDESASVRARLRRLPDWRNDLG